MPASKVFVFTNTFPFGVGEQFIEAEAVYWTDHFVVAPVDNCGQQTRDVAVPVDHRFAVGNSRKLHLADVWHVLGNADFWRELLHKPGLLLSPARLRRLVIFLVMAGRLYTRIDAVREDFLRQDVVVYTYWFSWATYAFARLKQRHSAQFRLVTRAHRVDVYRHGNPDDYMPLDKCYAVAVDGIYPVSQDAVDYLHATYGIPYCRMQVARLGVAPPPQLAARSLDGVLRILSVAYAKPVKRIDRIVDAVSVLRQQGLPIQWTHIGDGELLVSLQEEAKARNIDVQWLGQLSHAEVMAWYDVNPVDVFVSLSESEGVPVSIMEAMVRGIPVVATDVGGVREIVSEKNGFLLSPVCETAAVIAAINAVKNLDFDPEAVASSARLFMASSNYPVFIRSVL